jgi:hypothetical protein
MNTVKATETLSFLHSEPLTSPIFNIIHAIINTPNLDKKIVMKVTEKEFYINKISLDLNNKKKILTIYRLFCNHPNQKLSRDDLIQKIYNISDYDTLSRRQKSCLNHNIVKLISRSRKLAAKRFSNILPFKIEWFPYNSEEKSWKLIKINNEYYEKIFLSA